MILNINNTNIDNIKKLKFERNNNMKLLTINVHAWIEENQDEKMETLAKVIAEKDYDVIAMQEVNQSMNSPVIFKAIRQDNYGWVLLEKISKYTDRTYYYHWSNSHIGYDKYDEGLAIITKHRLLDVDEFYCTRAQSVNTIISRRINSATIEYKGQLMEFYTCHMNLPECEEEKMSDNIQTILGRSRMENLKILMGDFNTDAINSPKNYENILAQGLYDTYTLAVEKDNGVTVGGNIDGWDTNKQEKRIDYIFSNKKIKVLSSKIIFNGINFPVVSDHYGVETIIEI